MYKKILVAMALDHGIGKRALETARKLLDDGGEIIAIHVLEPIPDFLKNQLPSGQEEKNSNIALESIKERIGEANDIEPVVVIGHPGQDLVVYAEKINAECIILGSHKPSLADFFLGSTAARVARHATCSVHVIR